MIVKRSTVSSPRIEMLPLIDIVFLLLVFFIYAMLSMAVHHGMSVDLPQSNSAPLESTEAIGITIQATIQGDRIFIDKNPVSTVELAEELHRRFTTRMKDEKQEVQIFADKSIAYQRLFEVLDIVQKSGITKISLQAKQTSSQ